MEFNHLFPMDFFWPHDLAEQDAPGPIDEGEIPRGALAAGLLDAAAHHVIGEEAVQVRWCDERRLRLVVADDEAEAPACDPACAPIPRRPLRGKAPAGLANVD